MTHTDLVDSAPDDAPHARRGPTHASRPRANSARRGAATVGILAAVVAAAIGTVALLRSPPGGSNAPTPARKITVTAPVIPLDGPELRRLLDRPPDFGPLAEPGRRASCLAGLGYPAAGPVLGARQIQLAGRQAVVLVLPAEDPADLVVVAVPGGCSAAHTGLLSDTTVRRP